MIFHLRCSHSDAVSLQRCVICKRKSRVGRGNECMCFRVAGKVTMDGVINMETFLICVECYNASMSDYFDFADDGIWKNAYFQFEDHNSHLLYQFDDRFLCISR